jgi:MFS family permease
MLAGTSLLLSSPLGFLALYQPSGALFPFVAFLGASYLLMYTYYAAVYATIHDIVEPSLRGTAMAIYFFVMYLMGASLGPLGTGWLSDFLGRRAASAANVILADPSAVPEQFRAAGLHQAMYLIPLLTVVLAVILFAGALTVGRDMERLQQWMNQTADVKNSRVD